MTVLSGQTIRRLGIVMPCYDRTVHEGGMPYGLGPAGYDLTLDLGQEDTAYLTHSDRFCLAATREQFFMPPNVVGTVHDKSTLARQGLSVFNTVIEPGWRGFLTLELAYNGTQPLRLSRGMPIAQVVFSFTDEVVERPYSGRYQDQGPGPQGPRL